MQIINPRTGTILFVGGAILMIIEVLLSGANTFSEFSVMGWTGSILFFAGLLVMVIWVVITIINEIRR